MNVLMRTLPSEIQIIIGGYIGSCQPKKLCDDIKSYCKTSKVAKELYAYKHRYEPDQAYDWLVNDTIRFLNSDIPTMYGYQTYYKNIIKRYFSVKDKNEQEVNDILGQIDQNSADEDNNLFKILLGLLNTSERIELLNFFQNYDLSDRE